MLPVAVALAAVSAAAAWWVHAQGCTLWYGDAEAHLNIARRIIDSRTPGYYQIGTVWLPLPHVLMLAGAGNDTWWRSGLAGVLPAASCLVAAGLFLYGMVRRLLESRAAAVAAVSVFTLNPSMLYLASIPMTEALWFAASIGALYFLVRLRESGSISAAAGCGLAALAASMTRYEGWFLLPFLAAAVWAAGGWRGAALFCSIAAIGPLWWVAHNAWYYGNPLQFYDGPYSAKAIYQRGHAGKEPFPGDHHWGIAWLYFGAAARHVAGLPLVALGLAGCSLALRKQAAVVALLGLPPVFYVWSIYSANAEIFLPQLWPYSYYNTRYGLAVMPLFAFGVAEVVRRAGRSRPELWAAAGMLACVLPWVSPPDPGEWLCWKESQVNSTARRAWTREASEYMKAHYAGGGIFCNFGDQSAIFRKAGIPLGETLHDGNVPQYDAVLARPDLFLREEWAIAMAGDNVEEAVAKTGSRYTRVKVIAVEGAPVISIYKRN